MADITDERIDELANEVEDRCKHGRNSYKFAREFARALLSERGGEAVPVGYINRGIAPHTKGKILFDVNHSDSLETRWWAPDEPVYLAPPSPSDTERLDWLEKVAPGQIHFDHTYNRSAGGGNYIEVRIPFSKKFTSTTPSLRSAIDTARSAAAGKDKA